MYCPVRLMRKPLSRLEIRRALNRFHEVNEERVKERKELKYIRRCRVAIVGLGGVGKSLAHLLKMYPGGLTELRLCNRSDPEGVVEELNHIPTKLPVRGFKGVDRLPLGLQGADIVVMTAGVPRKPSMSRKQLFMVNYRHDLITFCTFCIRPIPKKGSLYFKIQITLHSAFNFFKNFFKKF